MLIVTSRVWLARMCFMAQSGTASTRRSILPLRQVMTVRDMQVYHLNPEVFLAIC